LRVLFLGSPPFATPILGALIESPWRPILVVTPQDKPRGRGRRVEPSPVIQLAEAAGIPLLHPPAPSGARDAAFKQSLRDAQPDVIVVASFGELLDAEFLDIALTLNVHGSLLPRHRGASPVQAALLAGDSETGVSIQRVVLALDAGDVLHQRPLPIRADATAGELFDELASLGAVAIGEALEQIAQGTATYTPQDPAQVTHCRKLKKEAGLLDWSAPATQLERLVRAMNPWPSAQTTLPDERPLKVHRAKLAAGAGEPGTVLEAGPKLVVATGAGALELQDIQVAGKRAMPAGDFLRGTELAVGTLMGATQTETRPR
jgi:methionyl-tRNA formyltransferase